MIEHLDNKIKITIQNELTINNAAEIYRLMAEGLNSEGDILISIPEYTSVDVTFLQILHSFSAKCQSADKKVLFEINGKKELVSEFIKMGYYDISAALADVEMRMEG